MLDGGEMDGNTGSETMAAPLSAAPARRGRAMAYFSPEGRLIEANAAFLALYGYSMGEVKGAKQNVFVAPVADGDRRVAAMWRQLSLGVAQHGEVDRVDSSGRTFSVLEHLEPMKDPRTGETKGVLCTAFPSRLQLAIRASVRTAFESEGAACV